MSATERLVRLGDRAFDRLRHRAAFTVIDGAAVDGDFDGLRDSKYAVLVTFKRDGTAVPSPVWTAVDTAGNVYVKTASHAGKIKRLRRDSRVLMAPSTMRGKPIGPAIRGTGRVLPEDEWRHAEDTLAAAHGMGRRIAERLLDGDGRSGAYIAITPRGSR